MKRNRKEIINDLLIDFLICLEVFLLISYLRMPDYKIQHSYVTSCDNYKETILDVQVHKAFFNKLLYKEIEYDYIRLNGKPDKIIMELYFFKWNYQTVIFDYENKLYYIKLKY